MANDAASSLTDDQILKVTKAVNEGEIEQAKIAQNKAENPRVKRFAAQMITQHKQAINKEDSLAKKAQLTPAESPLASELTMKSEQTLTSLKNAEAQDFDRSYILSQIEQHEEVLDLVNERLLPNAMNADLKSQLEKMRTMVETHLASAKDIDEALSGASRTGAEVPKSSPDTDTSAGTTGGTTGGTSSTPR